MDKKTRQFSIVSTIIFLILYFGYKHFKEESYNSKILGKWESKEVKAAIIFSTSLKMTQSTYKKTIPI